jgi:allophanate hydrolase
MTQAGAVLATIGDWQAAYRSGATPRALLTALLARLDPSDPAWILRCDGAYIDAQLRRLAALDPATAPLWGVPFAVKDNIDVAGLPTTAACPAFAYVPEHHATAVQRLLDAGAVLVGKTNLDQFATGLVGTRSPYGAVSNSFDAAYVSGGSSSGSSVVVARGLVPFALGTDTAGSGRVPAGFNNLVGWKPTPGRLGMMGVLPACKSLDVVSVFALTVADAADVAACIDGPDAQSVTRTVQRPAWLPAKPRIGVPAHTVVDAKLGYAAAWEVAKARAEVLGGELVPVDMQPFYDVAALLYDGPWVAERYAVVKDLIGTRPETMDATVRAVIERARDFDAVDAFEGRYRLENLALQLASTWHGIDVLMVPTAPTHPTLAAVAAEPVLRNSELGRYTNFVNLLGLAALAVPAGFTSEQYLPFGVTFIAPGGSDAALLALGQRWLRQAFDAGGLTLGARLRAAREGELVLRRLPAAAPTLQVAVVGAHLAGLPLHGQIAERGCRLVSITRTAPRYRLHALPGTVPPKPGLARVAEGEVGHAIELEVYEMPLDAVGSFLALIPPPMGLGSVELADRSWVKGFICEPMALAGAPDISAHGGWRAYLASLKVPA